MKYIERIKHMTSHQNINKLKFEEDLIRGLITKTSDIPLGVILNETHFALAVMGGNIEIFKNTSINPEFAMKYACKLGRLDFIKEYRDKLFDIQELLFIATVNKHLSIVKFLITPEYISYVLSIACEYDRLEIADFAIELNPDIIEQCWDIAVCNGNHNIVRMLYHKGCNSEKNIQKALELACICHKPYIVYDMIRLGAKITEELIISIIQQKFNFTPNRNKLSTREEIVILLLQVTQKENIDISRVFISALQNDMTPIIHYILTHRKLSMEKILLLCSQDLLPQLRNIITSVQLI